MAFAVEAEGRLAADDARVALIELEPDSAGDVRLAVVDRRLQHLALGREPETVVDELGIFRHQLVFQVRRAAVERDAFDAAVGAGVDFAAGRLVHAARLPADEAVFDVGDAAGASFWAGLGRGSWW